MKASDLHPALPKWKGARICVNEYTRDRWLSVCSLSYIMRFVVLRPPLSRGGFDDTRLYFLPVRLQRRRRAPPRLLALLSCVRHLSALLLRRRRARPSNWRAPTAQRLYAAGSMVAAASIDETGRPWARTGPVRTSLSRRCRMPDWRPGRPRASTPDLSTALRRRRSHLRLDRLLLRSHDNSLAPQRQMRQLN